MPTRKHTLNSDVCHAEALVTVLPLVFRRHQFLNQSFSSIRDLQHHPATESKTTRNPNERLLAPSAAAAALAANARRDKEAFLATAANGVNGFNSGGAAHKTALGRKTLNLKYESNLAKSSETLAGKRGVVGGGVPVVLGVNKPYLAGTRNNVLGYGQHQRK